MSRRRQVPDDDQLRRVFTRHSDQSSAWIASRYGWNVSISAVQIHRRRLMTANPIEGVASMSRAEFRKALADQADRRHAYLS